MKILILRFSSIGDIVLTTPVVRWLSVQKNAEIHFLCKNKYKYVISPNPHISKIYTFTKNLDEIRAKLKSENYTLIIDLQKNIRSLLLKLNLGTRSISFDKNNLEKWKMVNLKSLDSKGSHLVDRYLKALKPLGIKNDGLGLDYFFNEKELQSKTVNFKYQVLVLGATYMTKRIPIEICKKIIKSTDQNLILLGGPDVAKMAQDLGSQFPRKTLNYVGKLSLDESSWYIKHASYVNTSDTGLMHIAAAFQKNITVYWGNTIPEFGMYPYYGSKSSKKHINMEVELPCRPCSKIGFDNCPKTHFKCMMDQQI